jgi:adenylate cyclase
MGVDEESTLRTLQSYREIVDRLIVRHEGRIFATGGDSVLVEFASPVEAVRCAIAIQEELTVRNTELVEDRRMQFRIGINLGDVMVEGDNLFGDGVNVAARLEGIAEAGGICVSGSTFEQVKNTLSVGFEDIGPQKVKNIAEPVPAFRVVAGTVSVTGMTQTPAVVRRWRMPAIAAVVALILAAAGVVWWQPWTPQNEMASIDQTAVPQSVNPSIAVLPFTNISGDKEQEYFSDGVTENIITDLSKVAGLLVKSRTSTKRYRGKTLEIQQVSGELGVRYIVEGSVRKAANRVRITAQLIDASTGNQIWGERYDRDLQDIFAIQDDVSGKIVSNLAVTLTADERRRISRRHTPDPQAHDYVLRGFSTFVPPNTKNLNAAQPMFEKAIEIDPDYNMGYAGLATIHALRVFTNRSKSPAVETETARRMARKAISLEDTSARPHIDLARLLVLDRRFDEAVTETEMAIRIEPGHSIAQALHGQFLARAGRAEEGIAPTELALRLTSHDYGVMSHSGVTYFLAGEYPKSVENLEKAEKIAGKLTATRGSILAAAYVLSGNEEAARAMVGKILQRSPDYSVKAAVRRIRFKKKEAEDRLADALRKAGLRDG